MNTQRITLAQPSCMSLLIEIRVNNLSLGTGTGFLVSRSSRTYLVTNRHIVRGRHNDTDAALHGSGGLPDSLVIVHNALVSLGNWVTKLESLYDPSGHPLWLEHPQLGGRVDVVALPLSDPTGVAIYAYDPWSPGTPILAGPSDIVSVVGFPFGRTGGGAFGIWVQGTVASEPTIDLNDLVSS
jgi:S1-C subfamily serine protease